MNKKKIAVTITTINIPHVIEKLIYNYEKFKITNVVDYIVIGDLKSHPDTENYIKSIKKNKTSRVIYFNIEDQKKEFSKYEKLWSHIPYNSFARRNFADLYAFENKYDLIIRIDDDNFPIEQDFFTPHSKVGEFVSANEIMSSSGWFNVCESLIERDKIPFYPRGYPYDKRWIEQSIVVKKCDHSLKINAGLWLGDPDVDAITRICKKVDAVDYNSYEFGETFVLAKNTWSPINTQNTSFSIDLVPAAFVSPFSGRYDDIFSGYFLRKIMDHLGDKVGYGLPLVTQVRNEHNLWLDLEKEMHGNLTTPELCEILKGVNLKKNSYAECMLELVSLSRPMLTEIDDRFKKILDGMEIWAEIFINRNSQK